MTTVVDTPQDAINIANKYSGKENEQMEIVNNLKAAYNREKESLEAKINSITNYNNRNNKNNKVESKIISYDSVTQSKLDYFDIQIRGNEEKRQSNIDAINQRHDAYREHLLSQQRAIEIKKDVVIKDLSCNIIKSTLCDTIDEDAYPKLTKMKLSITEAEKKVEEYNKIKLKYVKLFDELVIIRDKRNEAENQQKKRDENAKEAETQRLEGEKKRRDNALKEEQSYKASMERLMEQEQLKDEEHKIKLKAWKKNLYATIAVEYKDYYSNLSGNKIQHFQKNLSSNEEIIEYIDTIKEQLDKYIALNKYIYDTEDSKFKHFDELTYDQRFEIAQINTKIKKIEKIKEYYAINEEENKEYPIYA